jgi:hypothetical protein
MPFLLSLVFLSACAPALVTHDRTAHHAKLPRGQGSVAVKFERQKGHVLRVRIFNTSNALVFVDRDGLVLKSEGQVFQRKVGSSRSFWLLQPGEERVVAAHFDLSELQPGKSAELAFENAIVVDGEPVAVDPVQFFVDA